MTAGVSGTKSSRWASLSAARPVFEIFFFTFPLLLILLPPDVFGDGLVGLYFVLLAVAWRFSAVAARRGAAFSPLAPIRRRRWLQIAVAPAAAFLLLFTGLFVGMLFALWPERFFITAGVLGAGWLLQRVASGRHINVIRITPARAWFALVWVSLISYTLMSKTWSGADCARVPAPGVRFVLTKARMEASPELRGMFPYMAEPDAAGENLYVSFKPVSKQFFRIGRVKTSGGQPENIELLKLPPGGERGMVQAIALDRARGRLYVPVSGGGFRLLEIDAGGGPLKLLRTIPLPGEVGDIVIDQQRSLLHMSIKPNRLVTYTLPALAIIRDRTAPVSGGIDFLATDPRTGDLFISTVGFNVARESRANGRFTKTFMLSSFGMAPAGGLLFTASPGAGKLYALDPATLRTVHALPLGFGLRSVASPGGETVYAASYASGMLHIIDTASSPPSEKTKIFLGKMLRRITAAPATGRVYAASTCGVVEIDPEKLKKSGK